MAKIVWTEKFHQQLDYYIGNASIEYGKTTALRWVDEIAAFEHRVSLFPTSYTPEELLRGKKNLYRRCHLMNNRFKLIFFYDEAEDTVHLVDIWDTRRNPKNLIKGFK